MCVCVGACVRINCNYVCLPELGLYGPNFVIECLSVTSQSLAELSR